MAVSREELDRAQGITDGAYHDPAVKEAPPAAGPGNLPYVTDAVLIDPRRIELHWSCTVTGAGDDSAFEVCVAGSPVELVHWTSRDPWNYGTIYELWPQRTTIGLAEPVDVEQPQLVTVRVTGGVRDLDDRAADPERTYPCRYEAHYQHFAQTRDGICVKAPKGCPQQIVDLAVEMIDVMLERQPEIGRAIAASGSDVALAGLKENIYDVPEMRMGQLLCLRPCGGFGGDPDNPTNAFMASNVMRLLTGRYATDHKDESALVHEIGHAIHLVGMASIDDRSLFDAVTDAYEHAAAAGLWPDTYLISNSTEYFATLSTMWFGVSGEGNNGTWDGVRGPVNTRAELKEYDPQGYELMARVYPDRALPAPWDHGADLYDPQGNLRPGQEAPAKPFFDIDWSSL